MQEMRQREEAMELDRALQRSIHLSQVSRRLPSSLPVID